MAESYNYNLGTDKKTIESHWRSMEYREAGDEKILDNCPFCGASRHCYVNESKGVFFCHRCGEKGVLSRLGMDTLQIRARAISPKIILPENKLFAETAFIYSEKDGKMTEETLESPKFGNERLWKNEVAIHYLTQVRKLWMETINYFELGLTLDGDLQIPFRDKGRLLTGYKYRSLPPNTKNYWRTRGSELPLFNESILLSKYKWTELFVTEGEFDAMVACQQAKPAVSSPLGAQGWDTAWTEMIKQSGAKKIYILYDNDNAGEIGAQKMLKEMQEGGIKCQIVNPFPKT